MRGPGKLVSIIGWRIPRMSALVARVTSSSFRLPLRTNPNDCDCEGNNRGDSRDYPTHKFGGVHDPAAYISPVLATGACRIDYPVTCLDESLAAVVTGGQGCLSRPARRVPDAAEEFAATEERPTCATWTDWHDPMPVGESAITPGRAGRVVERAQHRSATAASEKKAPHPHPAKRATTPVRVGVFCVPGAAISGGRRASPTPRFWSAVKRARPASRH